MHLGSKLVALFLASLVVSVAYAQDPNVAPPPVGSEPPPVGAVGEPKPGESGATPESPLSSLMQPYDYLDLGRKDPFERPIIEKPLPPGAFHGPVLPLQKFRLDELQLIGIIWDVARPRAMVKDPQNKIHVLGPNAKIGSQNGYIASIREGEIVVIETFEEEGKLRSDVRIVKLLAGKAADQAKK